jgi:hypothetical protein
VNKMVEAWYMGDQLDAAVNVVKYFSEGENLKNYLEAVKDAWNARDKTKAPQEFATKWLDNTGADVEITADPTDGDTLRDALDMIAWRIAYDTDDVLKALLGDQTLDDDKRIKYASYLLAAAKEIEVDVGGDTHHLLEHKDKPGDSEHINLIVNMPPEDEIQEVAQELVIRMYGWNPTEIYALPLYSKLVDNINGFDPGWKDVDGNIVKRDLNLVVYPDQDLISELEDTPKDDNVYALVAAEIPAVASGDPENSTKTSRHILVAVPLTEIEKPEVETAIGTNYPVDLATKGKSDLIDKYSELVGATWEKNLEVTNVKDPNYPSTEINSSVYVVGLYLVGPSDDDKKNLVAEAAIDIRNKYGKLVYVVSVDRDGKNPELKITPIGTDIPATVEWGTLNDYTLLDMSMEELARPGFKFAIETVSQQVLNL